MNRPFENHRDMRRPKVLFFADDVTLAHVGRMLTLAKSLEKLPVEVTIAAGSHYRSLCEATGLRVIAVETMGPAAFADAIARGAPVYTPQLLSRCVASDLALMAKEAPQLVVGDFRCSLGISAQLAKVPFFSVSNGVWSPNSTLEFPIPDLPIVRTLGVSLASLVLPLAKPHIFRSHLAPFNKVRKALGLTPYASLQEAYVSGTRTLYADIPALAPMSSLPEGHEYLGPILWEPQDALPSWWNDLPNDRPVIYVNLGSSGDLGVTAVRGLGQLPVTVLLATAGHAVDSLPANVFSAPYLPGLACARRASVVVCNGGSGSIYQALAAGVPVLAVPSNADQHLCSGALRDQGAGRLLRTCAAAPARVAREIELMLANRDYPLRARALQSQVSAYDAPRRFRELVAETLSLPLASGNRSAA